MVKSGLGKGLGALIGGGRLASPQPDEAKGERVQEAPLGDIVPSPLQPRKEFAEEELAELADSIKARGILQPLIVRMVHGKHELIAGERRWRAAQRAGLATAPVIVRTAGDGEVLELALVENLQRANLNPIEEAEGYHRLMNQFGLTQELVADRVGKKRASVANAVRLLSLPEDVRGWVRAGRLSVGHAKVVLSLRQAEEQAHAATKIIKDNLTVRETERLVESMQHRLGRLPAARAGAGRGRRAAQGRPAAAGADAALRDLESRLQRSLGTRVRIVGDARTGHLEISYFNAGDLDRLLRQLGLNE
jgi:ParB family chromosome partitioning protein